MSRQRREIEVPKIALAKIKQRLAPATKYKTYLDNKQIKELRTALENDLTGSRGVDYQNLRISLIALSKYFPELKIEQGTVKAEIAHAQQNIEQYLTLNILHNWLRLVGAVLGYAAGLVGFAPCKEHCGMRSL